MAGSAILILAAVAITLWVLRDYYQLPGHFSPTKGLLGQIGTVKAECTPHRRGKVYIAGAYWDAISEYGAIHTGKDVQVVEVREKFLIVRPVDLVGRGTESTENSNL